MQRAHICSANQEISRNLRNAGIHFGPGSSVSIVIERSRYLIPVGRDFPQLSRPALGPAHLLYNGYRVFPGGKERPGREADPSPPPSAVVMKG
jgi:hypothetical protein